MSNLVNYHDLARRPPYVDFIHRVRVLLTEFTIVYHTRITEFTVVDQTPTSDSMVIVVRFLPSITEHHVV